LNNVAADGVLDVGAAFGRQLIRGPLKMPRGA